MRAATASFAVGTLISGLLVPFVAMGASGPVAAATTQQAASQERVCRDVARPGSRIANRVCGTPAEVQAYLQQDFYAKVSDPLLLSGGVPLCWTYSKDRKWNGPCPKERPVEPTNAGP